MADIDVTNIAEGAKKAIKYIDNLTTSAGGTNIAMNLLKDSISHLGKSSGEFKEMSAMIDSFKDSTLFAGSAIDSFKDGFVDLGNAHSTISTKMLTETGAILATATGFSDMIFPASKAFDKLGESGTMSAASITDSYKRVASVLLSMPGFTSRAAEGLGKIMPKIDQARNAETALLRIRSQAGNLGDVYNQVGNNLEGLDQYMDNFGKTMQLVGNNTGMSSSQVTEFAISMDKIPGFSNKMETSLGSNRTSIDALSAAIKISKGTFTDLGTVQEIVSKQMGTFGSNAEDALGVIARMHSATQSLGIPFETMKNYVSSTAEEFKFFGNQSQAALIIMNDLAPALKKGGLAPEAISSMVKGITSGVKNLNIAQKSFISSQTGGPGGLQGGFQIEKMLRSGNMDGVFDKMKETMMNQFGGDIVGLDEATESQAGAAQMQKQISMLMDGPLGNMVGSTQEAMRLLEAMKSGTGPGDMLSTDSAVDKAAGVGSKFEDRQSNYLNNIANASERTAQLLAQQLYITSRAASPESGIEGVRRLINESREFANNEINKRVSAETNRSGGIAEYGAKNPLEAAIAEASEAESVGQRAKSAINNDFPEVKRLAAEKIVADSSPKALTGKVVADSSPKALTGKVVGSGKQDNIENYEIRGQADKAKNNPTEHVVKFIMDDNGKMKKIAELAILENHASKLSANNGAPTG